MYSGGGAPSVSSGGGSSSGSSLGGILGPQGLRAPSEAPDPDSDLGTTNSDGAVITTTTDRGDTYGGGSHGRGSYGRGHGGYSSTVCYYNYSVGHYYYDYRPVGPIYATQVKHVPSGGVDTGN